MSMYRLVAVFAVLSVAAADLVNVPVTFYNWCPSEVRLWCKMGDDAIGGNDGILLKPRDIWAWHTKAPVTSITSYRCHYTTNGTTQNIDSTAGGYLFNPIWQLAMRPVSETLPFEYQQCLPLLT